MIGNSDQSRRMWDRIIDAMSVTYLTLIGALMSILAHRKCLERWALIKAILVCNDFDAVQRKLTVANWTNVAQCSVSIMLLVNYWKSFRTDCKWYLYQSRWWAKEVQQCVGERIQCSPVCTNVIIILTSILLGIQASCLGLKGSVYFGGHHQIAW